MDLIARAVELCKNNPRPFATIDLDNSIIQNDSAEAVLAYMAENRIGVARDEFEEYYSFLDRGDAEGAYRFGAKTLRWQWVAEIPDIVRKTMIAQGTCITKTELLNRTIAKGIALRESVVDLMRKLRANGISVWVVSASPQLIVEGVVKYFNLEVDGCIGVRNVLTNGMVMGDLREPLSIFGGKVDCIKKIISPSVRPILGLGDSMNDLLMIEYAQLRVVVDRGNPLAAKARAEGWFIL